MERIQHAFYMAANYGFQILNGNFAAAIDDYELSLRFMNDLATYRIDVSWLWSLLRHQAAITKEDRKSTRLNSSHVSISYAVFCLKKKKTKHSYYTPSNSSY